MKPFKSLAPFLVLLTGAVATVPAMAHGPHVRFGIGIGVPLSGPGYYAPDYPPYYGAPYYYPPAVAASSPPIYVEEGNSQQAPAPDNNSWYYCQESKAYYPYVQQCPAGWQRVPAQPPA